MLTSVGVIEFSIIYLLLKFILSFIYHGKKVKTFLNMWSTIHESFWVESEHPKTIGLIEMGVLCFLKKLVSVFRFVCLV